MRATGSGQSELRVEAALQGDVAAAGQLVDALTPVIQSRVARGLLRASGERPGGLRERVQDLCQDVLLGLFADDGRILRSWDPDRGLSLENFVGLVAERQTASFLRSGRRNPWREESTMPSDLDGEADQPDPERLTASREELRKLLARMREELTPLGWTLFERLYLEERSVAEVGRISDMSADAVYAWRSRLRRLAATLLEEIRSESTTSARMSGGDLR